jgi:hypothetical protein
MGESKEDKELEVLVDLPITDREAFEHMVFGIKPVERPIRMSRSDYRMLKGMYIGLAIVCLSVLAAGAYQEGGSLLKDVPMRAIYP